MRAAGSTDDLYLRRVSDGPSEEIRLTDFGWEVGVGDWVPDCRRLVFASRERGGSQRVSKPWIVTIDPLSGKPVRVDWHNLKGTLISIFRVASVKDSYWRSQ